MRRYEPEIDEQWYRYDPEPTRTPKMVECREGEWVPYQVAKDEQRRLTKQVQRARLAAIEECLQILRTIHVKVDGDGAANILINELKAKNAK